LRENNMQHNLVFKKLIVYLAPLALIVLWEAWLGFNRAVVEVGLITLVIVAGAVWYLTGRSVQVSQIQGNLHRQEFWRFLISPGFFIFSVYLFLLIIESSFWRHFIIIAANLLLILILQNLFDRFYRASDYPVHSFESISGNINSLSLFLLIVSFGALITFLDMAVWQLALLLLFSVTLLTYQTMWLAGLAIRCFWLYLIIINLIVLEIFWVWQFLPNTFYVKALTVTIVYYLAVNLSRNQLLGLLNKKMLQRYLTVGAAVLILVLLTAQWL